MCTVTLELSDELVAQAQERGLLTSFAIEKYIRKSIAGEPFIIAAPTNVPAKKLTFAEAQQKIQALGVNLSVDRMLRQKHTDLALELEKRWVD